MPNTSRPQRSVAAIEYRPIVDIAIVTGSITQREVHRRGDEQLERPVPALALHRAAGRRAVAPQTPITDAPSDA